MIKSKWVCVFLSLILIFGIIIPVGSGFRVTGAFFEAGVEPGDHIKHVITIEQPQGSPPTTFRAEVAGLGQSLEGGNRPLKGADDTSPYSATSFLEVSPASLLIEPGGSGEFLMEGVVPADVGEGGRYAFVSIRSSSDVSEGNVGVAVGTDIPVILRISGTDLIKTGQITEMNVEESTSGEQQNVSLLFENTGNYHYKALARAVMIDGDGNILAEADTPLSYSSIIPTNTRLFELYLTPSDGLESGTYTVSAAVELEDGTVLGTEEAELNI